MQLINFLKENGIQRLQDELGIKVREYPEQGLYCFNYDQINSPKTHPVVSECRGVILDKDFNVVCRPFDRFFNLGEMADHVDPIDWSTAVTFDKLDGTLVKLYNWKGQWEVGTRSTAFAEGNYSDNGESFLNLILRTLNLKTKEDLNIAFANYPDNMTHLFELTSPENRIVTPYEDYSLWYLGSRFNTTGEHYQATPSETKLWSEGSILHPNQYSFEDNASVINKATTLPDMKEGYVVFQNYVPVAKIKSPSYVAIHHIVNGALTPKRVLTLIFLNEYDEYLTYFPKDKPVFDDLKDKVDNYLNAVSDTWDTVKHIEDQKEFALLVKDYEYSFLLFMLKKSDKLLTDIFQSLPINKKISAILKFYSIEDTEE